MIDLERTEMVLFDFDDTLCIHEVHGDVEMQEFKFDIDVLKYGIDAWRGMPSVHM